MNSKKVLIIKLGALGDIVHTTIIAETIKNHRPDWTVDFLTSDYFAPILNDNKYIDNIIKWKHEHKSFKGFFCFIKRIFNKHYDYILSPTLSLRTLLISAFALPKKIKFRKKYNKLWVEDYFQMAKSIIKDAEMPTKLTLGVSTKNNENIKQELSKYPKPYFIFAPGRPVDNTRQGRLWNINKWKSLSEMIISNFGGTIFVIGTSQEKITHNILETKQVIIKSGEYDFEQIKSLLSQADLVISGDTGPVHVASALNVKTLALLGSTSPKQIKPYGDNGHYISANYDCLYCWQKKCPYLKENEIYTPCMENLTPETVLEKIKEILRN